MQFMEKFGNHSKMPLLLCSMPQSSELDIAAFCKVYEHCGKLVGCLEAHLYEEMNKFLKFSAPRTQCNLLKILETVPDRNPNVKK